MSKRLDFTVGLPCRNRIKFCNQAIESILENSDYPILIIDDASDNPDGSYIKNPRVRVVYNKKHVGLTKLWNQIIKESKTEYVIISGDKIRFKKKDFKIIEAKLRKGFALVGTYMMGGVHSFSKHLTTIIGMNDEGYKLSGFEDTDLMNKCLVNNLAFYLSSESEYIQIGSGWKLNDYNGAYYRSKWIEDKKKNILIQCREDQNIDDINYYKNDFRERKYLPFNKSEILIDDARDYYKNTKGIKRIKNDPFYRIKTSILTSYSIKLDQSEYLKVTDKLFRRAIKKMFS